MPKLDEPTVQGVPLWPP